MKNLDGLDEQAKDGRYNDMDCNSIAAPIKREHPEFLIDGIKRTVLKARSLIVEDKVRLGFEPNTYFVSGNVLTPNLHPTVEYDMHSNKITCDTKCLHYSDEKWCSHSLAVAKGKS